MENKFEQITKTLSKNYQVLIGRSNVSNSLIRTMMDNIDQKRLEEIAKSLNQITDGVCMSLSDFAIDENAFELQKQDIPSLKKRIKHCKNHMERTRLQKELNALYKEQKKRK